MTPPSEPSAKLKAIREAVLAALPRKVREEKKWEYDNGLEMLRLADILLVILTSIFDKKTADSAIFRLVQGGEWFLHQDCLEDQPAQTISFLYELLLSK